MIVIFITQFAYQCFSCKTPTARGMINILLFWGQHNLNGWDLLQGNCKLSMLTLKADDYRGIRIKSQGYVY